MAALITTRRLHLRLIGEAERMVELNLPLAAVAMAGVLLDSLLEDRQPGMPAEDNSVPAKWRDWRVMALHPDSAGRQDRLRNRRKR
jgi:hypothetical protein